MTRTSLLALLAASLATFAGAAGAVEIAQPDEALVQRFVQHPDELASRIQECARLSMAEAVGNAACVSTQEARYRRERAVVLRASKNSSPTLVAQNVSTTTIERR